jgi:hypothetical protein
MTHDTASPHTTRPGPAQRSRTGPVLALCAALPFLLTACGGSGTSHPSTTRPEPLPSPTSTTQRISERNLGYTWPLTVDHGTARCGKDNQALFTSPDGTTYALNDRARDAGYRDIGPLRAKGDDGDPISLGSLLTKTLRLCGAAG